MQVAVDHRLHIGRQQASSRRARTRGTRAPPGGSP
jgi:hypothetical protein